MSRRGATFTQADVRRAIRAAKQEGAESVESGPVVVWPTEDNWYERGTIYFVACGAWVKIGFATNLDNRIRALQAANPEPLTVLHTVDGTIQTEREFHKRFAPLRGSGEWFKNDGELAAWLKEPKT